MGKLIFGLISVWSLKLELLVLTDFKFSVFLDQDCPYYDYDKEVSWHRDNLIKTLPTISKSDFE